MADICINCKNTIKNDWVKCSNGKNIFCDVNCFDSFSEIELEAEAKKGEIRLRGKK